jgi:MCP family monocarboxylic acid transporter-like MFS transporter 10
MSEKSLGIEALQGIDSASEDRRLEGLYYHRWKPPAASSVDQGQASHIVTDLEEAPDGGLRAWLVVVALVRF